MEPITTLTYAMTSFFGYYIGADMYNYIKMKIEFNEIRNKLDTINSHLYKLDSIETRLNRIDSKLD